MSIGTWNILSWHRTGASTHAVRQLEKLEMDITAIQEIRWLDSGELRISKSHIFYSGNQNGKHDFETGFVVSEKVFNSVIGFNPVSERICSIRLKGPLYNYSIISVHSPTEEKNEDIKEEFSDQLETAIMQLPKQDMLILCGDFNAKIGRERMYKPTIGIHSLHNTSNDNGMRLIQLAASNNLLVKSTMFEHKDIHKQTWISNDGITRNQIDHILVDARHASNVLDVRSLRGADADTDHILVRAKVRMRISNHKNKRAERSSRWEVCKLSDERTKNEFQKQILENLPETYGDESVNEIWGKIERSISVAAKEILGPTRKKKHKDWFDGDCRRILEQREKARMLTIQEPNDTNRRYFSEVKRNARILIRTKKRRHEQQILEELETNFRSNQLKEFYKKASEAKSGFRPRTGNILKKDDGTLITNEQEMA